MDRSIDVSRIEHSGIEISADKIKTKLMDMCAEVGTSASSENAFLAKGTQRLKNGNPKVDHFRETSDSKTVKTLKCYKCKQIGHYKNQCQNSENNKRKQSNAFSAIFMTSRFNQNDWYIDSGASRHMTARQDFIVSPSHQLETKEVIIANQTSIPVLCSGDVKIVTVLNDQEYDITVRNVLCIPSLTTNLLSVSELIENGNRVIFKESVCFI